jgi:hypothetical protein
LVEPGVNAFQAHVMGATRIAEADSNVVFLHVGVKEPEKRAPEDRKRAELEEALRPSVREQAAEYEKESAS